MFRMSKYLYIAFVVLLLFGVTQQAHAILSAVDPGPYTVATGNFPQWYQDASLDSLDLCLTETASPTGLGPMCTLLPDAGFSPASPVAFPANFPQESFYFMADAKIGPGGGVANYRAAVEAAFATGTVADLQQITFTIVRYSIDIPAPGGTYTVTHPYGSQTFVGISPGPAAIKFKQQVGGVTPGVFTDALGGTVGPYLHGIAGPIVIGGQTFIGDPNVTTAVIGSPTGFNKFRVDGPNIGGVGVNFIETDQFNLAGIATGGTLPTHLTVQSATYSRGALSGVINVLASSTPNATLEVAGGPNLPVGPTPMTPGLNGNFFASIALADATVLPPIVNVTANGGAGTSATTLPANLVDAVTITKASYSPGAKSLTIQATSGDGLTPQTLTATGFVSGTLTPDAGGIPTLVVSPLGAPPATVTVNSTGGGTATASVSVVPEKLRITTATFKGKTGTWHIKGSTNVPGAVIRIFNTPNMTAPLLGKVTANAQGVFDFTLTGAKGRKAPNVDRMISAKSSGQGKVQNRKVRVFP